ncbi:MAG: lactonase family protein [Steroidobacterales bacterium]
MSVVYVANADGQDISVFGLGADGALHVRATVAAQSPPQSGRSMLLCLSPNRRFLYAAFLSGGTHFAAATFAIDGEGGIPVLIGTTALADTMAYMATDRSGRYLLCASYYGNRVTVNAIGGDSCVGALLQSVATEPKAHCIFADATNLHVLYTSLGGDLVYQNRFDAGTGHLSPNEPPTVAMRAKSGPRFLAPSPDGRFVYVNGELDGSISVYPLDGATGTLQPRIQAVSVLPAGFAGAAWAADLRMTPDGAYLYSSERTSSTLSAFAVDRASGLLRPAGSVPTVKQPRALAIDPDGRYLIAAGQLSNSVIIYAIDPGTGALGPLGEYPVGRNPTWIEITGRGFAAASSIATPMRP